MTAKFYIGCFCLSLCSSAKCQPMMNQVATMNFPRSRLCSFPCMDHGWYLEENIFTIICMTRFQWTFKHWDIFLYLLGCPVQTCLMCETQAYSSELHCFSEMIWDSGREIKTIICWVHLVVWEGPDQSLRCKTNETAGSNYDQYFKLYFQCTD